MITEEQKKEKICLFCASDYHLEMILLPYIKNNIENSNFIILTETNLEESLNLILTKVNLNEEIKGKIKKIDWTNSNEIKLEEIEKTKNDNINVIINGDFKFINSINKNIKSLNNGNFKIIDCYHVGDSEVDIEELSKNYKCVLNTQRI